MSELAAAAALAAASKPASKPASQPAGQSGSKLTGLQKMEKQRIVSTSFLASTRTSILVLVLVEEEEEEEEEAAAAVRSFESSWSTYVRMYT